jgi:hypothetical protein
LAPPPPLLLLLQYTRDRFTMTSSHFRVVPGCRVRCAGHPCPPRSETAYHRGVERTRRDDVVIPTGRPAPPTLRDRAD